jgi:DNA repair photolyase
MPMKTTAGNHGEVAKGRGSPINPEGRFERWQRGAEDDGWAHEPDEDPARPKTIVTEERVKSIITRNDSPDIGFSQSINPYRGCESGCSYCYARPSHAFLGLSPGIDFETRIFAKVNAAEQLREELARPGYACEPIALGVNTDAFQPAEREYRVTRGILEVLNETRHPVYLITKFSLIERDIDLLQSMARLNLASVTITLVTLDHGISRYLEPRATAPARRLQTIERLAAAGIPVNVNVAPVIPFLTDPELESILEAAAKAGAQSAAYTLLRLPWEVKDIFRAWLDTHFPLKAAHVMSRVQEMRGGRDNDPNFGSRMKGQGLYADFLKQRFAKGIKRFGLDRKPHGALDAGLFRAAAARGQASLF